MMFCSANAPQASADARAVYPWHELEADGRFFWPCNSTDEAEVARRSISAIAWKRYGKGKIKTRCENKGVHVIVRKPRKEILSDGFDVVAARKA
jgi:hypothetical protein